MPISSFLVGQESCPFDKRYVIHSITYEICSIYMYIIITQMYYPNEQKEEMLKPRNYNGKKSICSSRGIKMAVVFF